MPSYVRTSKHFKKGPKGIRPYPREVNPTLIFPVPPRLRPKRPIPHRTREDIRATLLLIAHNPRPPRKAPHQSPRRR